MLVVFPTTTTPLSAGDEEFIVATLATTAAQRDGLRIVLADPELRDEILDSDPLHAALLERWPRLEVPSPLDCYLLVRPALKRVGIADREVATYVAALLSSFTYAERTPDLLPPDSFRAEHLAKLVRSLRTTNREGRFMVLAYLGNYALLMGGLCPERLPYRCHDRNRPDLAYCDKLGRASFLAASHQPLAWEYQAESIFAKLARHFRALRIAVGDLAEQGHFTVPPA
jgi:hypothetical protein